MVGHARNGIGGYRAHEAHVQGRQPEAHEFLSPSICLFEDKKTRLHDEHSLFFFFCVFTARQLCSKGAHANSLSSV